MRMLERVAILVSMAAVIGHAQFTQQGPKIVGSKSGLVLLSEQGTAVALSADGNTAIVGGPYNTLNRNITDIGASWVYTRANGVWTQQAPPLVANDAVGTKQLQGFSVALSADGNTAIVGGPYDNFSDHATCCNGIGAAWIFVRKSGGFWDQQGSKLVPPEAASSFNPNLAASSSFVGISVAISGDGNTAIVGGPGYNIGAGAAWIFTRSSGAWSLATRLAGSGAKGPAGQGSGVAISTDGNTAVVGGSGDDSGTGAAWVFTQANGIWTQQGNKLVGTGAAGGASQGGAVAISGDGNTVLAGGEFDNNTLGAAWVFTRANGAWSQQGSKLVASDAPDAAGQGLSVALSANGNVALVGGEAGTWAFRRINGIWAQLGSAFAASDGAPSGGGVSLSGDGNTALVGGPQDGFTGFFTPDHMPGSVGAMWIFKQPASLPSIPPAPGSVSPAAGSGATSAFTFTFSDPGGWQNLTVVNILIRDVLDGRQACYVAFLASGANAGSVYLVDNQGDAGGPYSSMVLPGTGIVANGQCSITGAGSVVSASGNTLALTLPITFTPGFTGNKVVYLAAQNAGANSGWQAMGTWGVPGSAVAGPGAGAVTPGRGSGFTQTFTFNFTDTNGWQDITVANVLINGAIDGRAACYLAFLPSGAGSGSLYLVDNAGDAGGPYSGMLLPGNGSVSNGQCSISGAGSQVSGSGTTLALTLAIAFSQSFAGNRVVYLAAGNHTLNSGWQAVGTAGVN